MTSKEKVVANALSKVNTKVTVPTNPYGGQCVALIDKIVQEETGKNMSYTNAIDCLDKAKANGFQVTYDAVGVNPQAGDFYVIRVPSHSFGHIGVCLADSDGTGLEGVEQNVDGYLDSNRNGINDQLEVGGGGYTRRVSRKWYSDGRLVDRHSGGLVGYMVGWFRLPYEVATSTKKVETSEDEDMKNFVVRSKSGKQGYVAVVNGAVFGIGHIDTVVQLQSAGAAHLTLDDGDFNRFLESQKFDDEKLVASVQALEKAIKQ